MRSPPEILLAHLGGDADGVASLVVVVVVPSAFVVAEVLARRRNRNAPRKHEPEGGETPVEGPEA